MGQSRGDRRTDVRTRARELRRCDEEAFYVAQSPDTGEVACRIVRRRTARQQKHQGKAHLKTLHPCPTHTQRRRSIPSHHPATSFSTNRACAGGAAGTSRRAGCAMSAFAAMADVAVAGTAEAWTASRAAARGRRLRERGGAHIGGQRRTWRGRGVGRPGVREGGGGERGSQGRPGRGRRGATWRWRWMRGTAE